MSDTFILPSQGGAPHQNLDVASIPSIVPNVPGNPIINYDFLAMPEFAYSNLFDTSKFPAQQALIIDNQLNQFLRGRLNGFFSNATDDIKKAILPKLPAVDYRKYKTAALQDVVQHEVLDGLNLAATNAKLVENINQYINGRLDVEVSDVLNLLDALEDNPIFQNELRVARVRAYTNSAKLDAKALDNLLKKNMDPSITDDDMLDKFVQSGDIDATQSKNLNILLDLARLTDNNVPLINSLIARNITDTIQLVSMERSDWKTLLQKIGTTIFPPDENVDSSESLDQKINAYVETIYQNIDTAYPSQRFFNRLNDGSTRAAVNLLTSLNTLFQNGQVAIDNRELTDIDWSKINIENKEQAAADLQKLLEFANTFRQLGTVEIINDKTLEATAKIGTLNNRIELVNTLLKNNPTLDIQYVNLFSNNGDVNWTGIPDDEKPLIRKHLLTCQRMMELSDNTDDRHVLLKKGFDSASTVVNYSEADFGSIMEYEPIKAQQHHQRALHSAHRASHYFQTMHDVIRGNFKDLAVSNVDPSLINNMREVDGISDLFGPQNYFDCEDCRSVLSPAAYFVDLMEFIKEHISRPVFIRAKRTDSSMYLKNRRGDLWNLKLSCENTNTLIPYLTIADEVLENYIGRFTQGNVYEMLSNSYDNNSFQLPFNLPLEELRIYLSHFNYTLFDAFQLLQVDEAIMWQEQLKISKEEFEIIAGINANRANFKLGRIPGSNAVPINDTEDQTQNINLKGFENIAGIKRNDLSDLMKSQFNPGIKNIKAANISLNDNAYHYTEVLNNVSDADVDYMHRFTRLAKKTGWQIRDLDEILTQLQLAGHIGNALNNNAVLLVAKLHYIKHKIQLSIEQLCAMIHAMPVSDSYPVPPEKRDERRLFEKAFDLASIFGVADNNTGALNTTVNYHCYFFNTANPTDSIPDSITPFMLQGLGVSENELFQLFELLKAEIVFDPNGNTVLGRQKLSILYRHTKLARKLGLSIANFIYTLQLLFDKDAQVVKSIEQILRLIKFNGQLTKSGFEPEEIVFIISGADVINIPYSITTDVLYAKVAEIVASPDTDKVSQFKSWLGEQFNASENMLANMFAWVSADTSEQTIANALNTKFTNNLPDDPSALIPLVLICHQLERVQLLFTKFSFSEEQVDFLTRKYNLFGITDLKNLRVNNLFNLSYFKSLIEDDQNAEDVIKELLKIYQKEKKFTDDAIQLLAQQLDTEAAIVQSVARSTDLSSIPIEAISYTEQVLDVCKLLGINGHSLKKLVDVSSYQSIKSARNVALGAFSSKYEDEKKRDDKLEPYNDKINVLKRDALCTYILANETVLNFKSKKELYDFFLLDVEMGGCFRTSRLVCAISSLQLYITRVLANLEQSADSVISVLTQMSGLKDFKEEWEWRKSYRTWEASRKVFLYPENYIEPESLDIKSSIFKDLENELMQGKITKGAADSAYQNYITKFSELAKLKICGSFYDDDSNTYYFFGRTLQDPGQLYYRKWKNHSEWTCWEPTDLAINSEHVAATVALGKLFVFWLDIREDKQNSFENGQSYVESINYHYTLNYSFLKGNGKWNTVQKLPYYTYSDPFAFGENFSRKLGKEFELAIRDRFRAGKLFVEKDGDTLIIENYMTSPLPPSLVLNKVLDLFQNKVKTIKNSHIRKTYEEALYLYSGSKIGEDSTALNDDAAYLAIGAQDSGTMAGIDYRLITNNNQQQLEPVTGTFHGRNPYLTLIQGTSGSYYLRIGAHQYLIYGKHFFSGSKNLKTVLCLSSSLPDVFGEILFNHGLKQFLSPNTQMKTEEKPKVDLYHSKKLHPPYSSPDHIDFNGPYGNYFREIFFHIPFLIGNLLNANQKYEDAKWWYERIFDPAAAQTDGQKKDTDRNWRYIEFRNVAIEKMKDVLTDKAAINQYKAEPFNAHAIARLRIGTYQKAIVMKYIDNLLDWGDQLFTEFTMESVNQATMLYTLALNILGKRPVDKGPADIAAEDTLTYNALASQIEGDSDFLITLENWSKGHDNQKQYSQHKIGEYMSNGGANKPHGRNEINDFSDDGPATDSTIEELKQAKPAMAYKVSSYKQTRDSIGQKQRINYKPITTKRLPGHQTAKQACTAFCVPPNEQLLGYWDRVDDRLFKIRHCMNIKGVVKPLDLFAPGVNGKLLKKQDENMSFDDMLAALKKPLPPYRFIYLIEKARQFTQTVQGLGTILLSALEKKDIEQLTLMRSRHEKEILGLTTKAKEDALDEAKGQLQVLKEQQKNIQNRIDYYSNLIDAGLITSEVVEQDSRITATALEASAGDGFLVSAIEHLVAQLGSPFAITYGGTELGMSATAFAAWFLTSSSSLKSISESAGLLASFDRRGQDWQQQLKLANQEMQQMLKQLSVAEIRVGIAKRDLTIHQKNIQHNQEVNDFYLNKFSNLGLYKFLSATLKNIYRNAYHLAFDLALQAEQVYQFETDDDTLYISGNNWQHQYAGLLAGERLNLQLHRLEQAYIENNKRNYEINQSVSLALIDPQALLQLKRSGTCTFTIPEMVYDIVYPGQYKRIIKSVRITIPCVTGPYTNISAKLTLVDSWARTKEKLNTEPLKLSENSEDEIRMIKNTSITTSSAQNDGGLFELNFRDERYLPFEGAGAVSSWKLELPATIRSFNYDTISDVIFHVSYTAKDDTGFRGVIEQNMAATLTSYAQTNGLLRLFSLKYDFPEALYKLLNGTDPIQNANLEITKNHFPYLFANKDLSLVKGTVYVKPLSGHTISDGFSVKLNTQSILSWNNFPGDTSMKEGSIALTGSPVTSWTIEIAGLKKEDVDDLLILIQYRI